MQLEVFFSFDDREQKEATYPFVKNVLDSKETFFEFVTSMLSGKEKEQLSKISCCVYYAIGLDLPEDHWYHVMNGKFYREEIIPLMKQVWAIKSLIPENL